MGDGIFKFSAPSLYRRHGVDSPVLVNAVSTLGSTVKGVFFMRDACSPLISIPSDAECLGGFDEFFARDEVRPYAKFVRVFFKRLGINEPFLALEMIDLGLRAGTSPADPDAMLALYEEARTTLSKKILLSLIPKYFERLTDPVDWSGIADKGIDLQELVFEA